MSSCLSNIFSVNACGVMLKQWLKITFLCPHNYYNDNKPRQHLKSFSDRTLVTHFCCSNRRTSLNPLIKCLYPSTHIPHSCIPHQIICLIDYVESLLLLNSQGYRVFHLNLCTHNTIFFHQPNCYSHLLDQAQISMI